MASPPREETPAAAAKKGLPAPGTVPKLPQTIFNLEKRGGTATGAAGRPARSR